MFKKRNKYSSGMNSDETNTAMTVLADKMVKHRKKKSKK